MKHKQLKQESLMADLYEFTMAAGYFQNEFNPTAVFELICHSMPKNRSFLLNCGLEQMIDFVLNLRFNDEQIRYLKSIPALQNVKKSFFQYLRNFRFSGDIWAMPEGQVFFANEPVIQVVAPIIEAQILETYFLSIMNIETLVASKAARIVCAAQQDEKKRTIVDFGSRRAHGPEAGFLAARAAYIAGALGTSNVYAGKALSIPVYGTIAHSFIQAFKNEEEAFFKYSKVFPENMILLIDTYDTVKCAKKLCTMKIKHKIKAVRLDSGDLCALSKMVRKVFDQAGLKSIKIIASGNLNEFKIQKLIKAKAPIDIFGVGTEMVTSKDDPALDLTYKLVELHDSKGAVYYKAKHSQGKMTMPARKQIFRKINKNGQIEKDIIGIFGESIKGTRQLLKPVVKKGRLIKKLPSINEIKNTARKNIAQLPAKYIKLKPINCLKPKYSQKLETIRYKFFKDSH